MFFNCLYREKRKDMTCLNNINFPSLTRVQWRKGPFPKSSSKANARKKRGHRPSSNRGRPAFSRQPDRRTAQPPEKNILTFLRERNNLATFFLPFCREKRKKQKGTSNFLSSRALSVRVLLFVCLLLSIQSSSKAIPHFIRYSHRFARVATTPRRAVWVATTPHRAVWVVR